MGSITVNDEPVQRQLTMSWDLTDTSIIVEITPLEPEEVKKNRKCEDCGISIATHVKNSGGVNVYLCYVCVLSYVHKAKAFEKRMKEKGV